MYKQAEIPGARMKIYLAGKDLKIVKELVEKSKLAFWQIWIKKGAALASHPSCIEW